MRVISSCRFIRPLFILYAYAVYFTTIFKLAPHEKTAVRNPQAAVFSAITV
ncbi:hypothetical protein B4096_2397 [Heyndrickxia coagulans]|uniref:Uncharacterized protein n=1 Tax=Heyndrickxia coagulans TaxID=1398 RepID=A0A133KNR0_HEYCO|nr:hypothetical protein BCO26_2187 [Heyndrickxia coagulans 2-6]KWZ81156.1 hypothetical protein HMPREF3213_02092 [Heyndrickxia coagulans]KYC66991.1 hypothetical protein B4100_2469 [Heyndrickxia coagulans]KYC90799.1 hypothetical protein B4096_2397 [Heyndrickxia coagulans]